MSASHVATGRVPTTTRDLAFGLGQGTLDAEDGATPAEHPACRMAALVDHHRDMAIIAELEYWQAVGLMSATPPTRFDWEAIAAGIDADGPRR